MLRWARGVRFVSLEFQLLLLESIGIGGQVEYEKDAPDLHTKLFAKIPSLVCV